MIASAAPTLQRETVDTRIKPPGWEPGADIKQATSRAKHPTSMAPIQDAALLAWHHMRHISPTVPPA
jgi:hypothetical protein